MADSATTRNRFRKQEVGAKTNAWGGDLNEDGGSDRLDESLDGIIAFSLSGSKTLTSTNYETDEARMRIINVTGGTGGTVTIPAVEKWYVVINGSSGSVVIDNGTNTVSINSGDVTAVVTNGTTIAAAKNKTYVDAAILAASLEASLPSQTGNAGKFITTDGSDASWADVAIENIFGLQDDLDALQPLDATLTALAAFSTNGLLTRTGSDTFAGRTITAADAKISITNGSGVSGNPTIAFGSVASTDLSDTASVCLIAASQALTNKTFDFASNTVTMTLAQLNTAVSNADIAPIVDPVFTNEISVTLKGSFGTPNSATTGGVQIRGNATSGYAYLQFTNSAADAEWGYARCNSSGVLLWSGSLLLGTDLAVTEGGTGASTASGARTNLGLVIGTDVAAAGANTDITALDQDVTITATGTIAANSIGFRGLPTTGQSQGSGITLALADAGKAVPNTTGGWTIPANGSVAFPVGTTIVIVNNSGSSQNIAITTDTLRQAGTANTGTRALAQYGVATIYKVASTTWIISGAGIS